MSDLKVKLGGSVFLIVVYIIAWRLNVANPFSYVFFAIAGLLFIQAILLRLKIVEYGPLFVHSVLGLLFTGVACLMIALAGFSEGDLFLIIAVIMLLIGVILQIKAAKQHKTE